MYFGYDTPLDEVPEGILTIPMVANLSPVAWVTGADIHLGKWKLDRKFGRSLDGIQQVMKEWHPAFPFSTKIHAEREETRDFGQGKSGILYSGGLDSTASYLRNRERNPSLVSIRGAPDERLYLKEYWDLIRTRVFLPFSQSVGADINFIETNIIDILNSKTLDETFAKSLNWSPLNLYPRWWTRIHFGIAMLGTCAPLTYAKQIETLIIAAGSQKVSDHSSASHPRTDELVRWGNLKVVHDSIDLTRQEKITKVVGPFVRDGNDLLLRVCWTGDTSLRNERTEKNIPNCGKCGKCLRTIAGLLAERLDPTEFGFDMSTFSIEDVRKKLLSSRWSIDSVNFWKDIQHALISRPEGNDFYDSDHFFESLSNFDIDQRLRLQDRNLHSTVKRVNNVIRRSRRALKIPCRS